MDDIKPFAEAMTVVGDRIQYVGSVETAKALCDDKTAVYDFSGKYIYELCPDKPFLLNSAGAHSLLLNTAAIKKYGITAGIFRMSEIQ